MNFQLASILAEVDCVWRREYHGATAIVISPDGQRMAVRRGHQIQLQPLPALKK
jgi:hypothetical protein